MTHFDKQLIDKAEALNRFDYREIDKLIPQADTDEARRILNDIRWERYYLVQETL